MTILVSLVWVASCCTSFAFNKNDYSKEFGYDTRVDKDDEITDENQPLATQQSTLRSPRSDDNAGGPALNNAAIPTSV